MHALIASTIPAVPISSYGTAFELAYHFRQSQITHLFVQPRLLSVVRSAAKEVGLPDDHIHILERKGHALPGPKRRSFDDWINLVRSKGIPRAPVQPAPKVLYRAPSSMVRVLIQRFAEHTCVPHVLLRHIREAQSCDGLAPEHHLKPPPIRRRLI